MNGGGDTECTSAIYHAAAENVSVCLCRALSTVPIGQLVGVAVYLQEIWTVMWWSRRCGTGLDAAALCCILPSVIDEPPSSPSNLLIVSMCTTALCCLTLIFHFVSLLKFQR